jgi:hypothetical protein
MEITEKDLYASIPAYRRAKPKSFRFNDERMRNAFDRFFYLCNSDSFDETWLPELQALWGKLLYQYVGLERKYKAVSEVTFNDAYRKAKTKCLEYEVSLGLAKEVPDEYADIINDSFEEVDPDYLASVVKRVKLYRFNKGTNRYYYEFEFRPDLPPGRQIVPHSYISITSAAHEAIPFDAGYYNYLMRLGRFADLHKTERMIFGNIFHDQAMVPFKNYFKLGGKEYDSHPIHGKGYNFDYLDVEVDNEWYLRENGKWGKCTILHMMVPPEWRHKVNSWRHSFKKGLMSWFQFCKDRVVDVIAIEFAIRDRGLGLAATIDLVFLTKWRRRTRLAGLDIKSFLFLDGEEKMSREFFKHHKFQLEGIRQMWNKQYSDVGKMELIFNWAPKNWRVQPTYTLTNQTDNEFAIELEKKGGKITGLESLMDYLRITGKIAPPTKVSKVSGKFNRIEDFDFNNHINDFSLIY